MDIEENQNRRLCVILEVEPKSPKALVQKARTFTIVSVSSFAIVPVSGNTLGWVNRNTIFQCTGNDHSSFV